MKFEITEEQLKESFDVAMTKHIKSTLNGRHIEYWIREEVHKLIAKEIIDKVIARDFPKDKIKEIMKRAFEDYVREKMDD